MKMGLHPHSENSGEQDTHTGEAKLGVYAATNPRRSLALEAGIGKKIHP